MDPLEVNDKPSVEPVPVFGWGTMSDQYGRISDGLEEDSLIEPEIPILSQVSPRVSKYPILFERDDEGRIGLHPSAVANRGRGRQPVDPGR